MNDGRPAAGFVYDVSATLVRTLVRLLGWRFEVRGVHYLPDRGGAVVAFNHHGYLDPITFTWGIYIEGGRPLRFLAKRELFEKPIFGWLVRRTRMIPVDRGSRAGRRDAYEDAVDALRRGEVLAIAPEETISQSFELLPFSTGAVRLARDARVPVVPCVAWGAHRVATKGVKPRLLFRLPVLVRYGAPRWVGPDADVDEETERLRQTMAEMLDDLQRSYPVGPEPGDDWWVPHRLGGSAPPHEEVLRRHEERRAHWTGADGDDGGDGGDVGEVRQSPVDDSGTPASGRE